MSLFRFAAALLATGLTFTFAVAAVQASPGAPAQVAVVSPYAGLSA